MLDVDALSTMIADIVSEEVGKAVKPLHDKISELEARPPGAPMDEVKAVAEIMISDAFVTRSAKAPSAAPDLPNFEALVSAAVSKAVSELPKPKDGKDAANIVEALKHEGELVLTLEDGRLVRTGIRDGARGKDGFALNAFDVDKGMDGRTYILKFDAGDIRHEYELTFPVPVYCGVFKEGDSYVPGDMVTWGGSLWHCDAETKDKPGTEAWTLAVKKGRDGKDAKPNG